MSSSLVRAFRQSIRPVSCSETGRALRNRRSGSFTLWNRALGIRAMRPIIGLNVGPAHASIVRTATAYPYGDAMHTAPSTSLKPDIVEPSDARAVYRKVTWRLLPFLFVCYVFAYLDRANIGFAHLQFSRDVGMSEAAFGLGVGLFYAGYMLFEVPSNLWLQRVGVRRTLLRIMVLWGIVSAGTAFVQTPAQ